MPLNMSARLFESLQKAELDFLSLHYDEEDRIDDVYIEAGIMVVNVNRGNVGSGTIEDRYFYQND